MIQHDSTAAASAEAAARVFSANGVSWGERVFAAVIAIAQVAIGQVAFWALGFALLLTIVDFRAGKNAAWATDAYDEGMARAGWNSKGTSWVVLCLIWLSVLILHRAGHGSGDAAVSPWIEITWGVPAYFTLTFCIEEFKSIYRNLGQPNWLKPFIDLLDSIESVARRLLPRGAGQ